MPKAESSGAQQPAGDRERFLLSLWPGKEIRQQAIGNKYEIELWYYNYD